MKLPNYFLKAIIFAASSWLLAGCMSSKPVESSKTPLPNSALNRSKGLVKSDDLRPAEELLVIASGGARPGNSQHFEGGTLLAVADGKKTPMPLQATDVNARIAAYIASVTVAQHFQNPYSSNIDAEYQFPLPAHAALNDFVMTIGSRHIRGIIRERAEAERIYMAAKRQGYTASLLNEEPQGLFSQSIANIEPGKIIETQITYFHTLTLSDGWWEFVFPIAADSPDRDKFALNLSIDAGLPIEKYECQTHQITASSEGSHKLEVSLANPSQAANADFVFRYRAADMAVGNAPPPEGKSDEAVRAIWARSKMDHLLQTTATPEQIQEIRRLALDYNLLSPLTGFLSIDTSRTNQDSKP
jgi:hypothetical protein